MRAGKRFEKQAETRRVLEDSVKPAKAETVMRLILDPLNKKGIGRGCPSHGWGHRFNPYTAHHFFVIFQTLLTLSNIYTRQESAEQIPKTAARSVENPWTLFG